MAERTQGQLRSVRLDGDLVLVDEDGEEVVIVQDSLRSDAVNHANARRLAAAWNATQDIPTDALEAVARHETAEGRLNALARVPGAADKNVPSIVP
jgi:hypothetical protein